MPRSSSKKRAPPSKSSKSGEFDADKAFEKRAKADGLARRPFAAFQPRREPWWESSRCIDV